MNEITELLLRRPLRAFPRHLANILVGDPAPPISIFRTRQAFVTRSWAPHWVPAVAIAPTAQP